MFAHFIYFNTTEYLFAPVSSMENTVCKKKKKKKKKNFSFDYCHMFSVGIFS